jgi:hypothetical protein
MYSVQYSRTTRFIPGGLGGDVGHVGHVGHVGEASMLVADPRSLPASHSLRA